MEFVIVWGCLIGKINESMKYAFPQTKTSGLHAPYD